MYIGQSINIEKRFANYSKIYNCNNQTKLYNSFKKYGVENHSFEVVIECKESQLNELERYYQDLYNVIHPKHGLNCKLTKSFVQDWAKEHIYGVKNEIKSKYLDKGLMLEYTAIDKAIEWLDLPFTIKNEKFFEDDFFTGTPDLIVDGVVYDIKCSFSPFTFPLFENKIPTSDYEHQVNVYMHLTGLKKASVVYILLETPEELNYGEKEDYSHLPIQHRIKTFSFEYDENIILQLQEKVKEARKYIETIKL